MIYDLNGNAMITAEEIKGLFLEVDESRTNYIQCFDKITGIGDSLMAGFTATPNLTVSSANAKLRGANWLAYMGMDIGRIPTNLAVGNTTTHDWRYAQANADIANANIDTNCYIVGLGVNDSRHSETIGTSADIKSSATQNADSFYGNMDYIVRTLHGYNADAHIFLFTIPGDETSKTAINTAIRHIAGLYPAYAHCVDLDQMYSGIYASGFIDGNLYNGHYNPIAYRLMASYIERALSAYIYANYQKFKNIPYQL